MGVGKTTIDDVSYIGLAGRRVAYNGVYLPYSSIAITAQAVMEGGLHLFTQYRIRITGIDARSAFDNGHTTQNQLRNRLLERGHSLAVFDRASDGTYVETLRIVPGTSANLSQFATPNLGDSNNRIGVVDVRNGPVPVTLTISTLVGEAYRYEYVLEVTTLGLDAIAQRLGSTTLTDSNVASLLANVTYGIDENHYVTRQVRGVFVIASRNQFGPRGNAAAYATSSADVLIRKYLSTGTADGNLLFSILSLPDGFVRENSRWAWDESLSQVSFEIVDREVYRTPPKRITKCEAVYRVAYDGIGYGKPLRVGLAGYMESAKDVAREEVMVRILELSNILMGTEAQFGRYVDMFQYDVSLYRNHIAFEQTGFINFGELSAGGTSIEIALSALGLGGTLGLELDTLSENNRSFAPTLFGTGSLIGSAYASVIATGVDAAVRVSPLATPYSRPQYSPDASLFFNDKQGQTTGVQKTTVALSPGQVRLVSARNETIVFPRDAATTGAPADPVVVRSQAAAGLVFYGWTRMVYQFDVSLLPEIIPTTLEARLSAKGDFRIEHKWIQRVFNPSVILMPFSPPVNVVHVVWRLSLNNASHQAVIGKYGSVKNAETSVNAALEKIGPRLEDFAAWLEQL